MWSILLPLPSCIIFYQNCLRDYQELQTKATCLINMCGMKKVSKAFIDEIVDIALDETQIPLSIFTNLFHQRFEKHSMLESMLEILQQFYIQMETEPHDFLLFPWRFFLIHLKVYEMLPACYSCWLNWRNSIRCTHCNVISLEHDLIP